MRNVARLMCDFFVEALAYFALVGFGYAVIAAWEYVRLWR